MTMRSLDFETDGSSPIEYLQMPDGRRLDIRLSGPADGVPFVFHHGTPGARTPIRALERAAHHRGLRLVATSRPGYGDSTRQPGRSVVDVAADTAAVLAAIGATRCLVAGWSGGGPHALACAARLDSVEAALVIAGIAPYGGKDSEWMAGMGASNVVEFEAALEGEKRLRPLLIEEREGLKDGAASDVASSLHTLLAPMDRAVLTGEFADDLTAGTREALQAGVEGWIEDDLALTKPWGFDLREISLPTMIWQGTNDLMVPLAHGKWLASHVPRASVRLEAGEGHLSLAVRTIDRMLDELVSHVVKR